MTESDIRAFTHCSKYYHLNDSHGDEFEQPLKAIKYAFEKIISISLREEKELDINCYAKTVSQLLDEHALAKKLLPQQTRTLKNISNIWLGGFITNFKAMELIPILGPFRPRIKVSKTIVELDIACLFREAKRQTLHAYTFTPSTDKHTVLNDIPTHLKLQVLKPLVKEHYSSGRPRAILHNISSTYRGDFIDQQSTSEQYNENYLKMIELTIQQMEQGYSFPILPCLNKCPFKRSCFPENTNV